MKIRSLYLSTAVPALAVALSLPAIAQTSITEAQTTPVVTSTAATDGSASDVTVTSTGSVTVTTGAAVTLDSDNTVTNSGTLATSEADDTTGILISGTHTGTVTNTGTIQHSEALPTDGIPADTDIAQGSGRVGILISGASAFTGNIENSSTGNITVSGQDSAGIRITHTAKLIGNLTQNGGISVFGERSHAVDISGDVDGNVVINGTVRAAGMDSSGLRITGDVSGGVSLSSDIAGTGFISSAGNAVVARPTAISRTLLETTASLRQAGSTVLVNGNIGNGIRSAGSISIFGSAPAILIDGNGTPIAIGRIGQITDSTDDDYEADEQYAFLNQGTLTANAIFDDLNATAFTLTDASLQDGINNTGTMQSTVYRSGVDPLATMATPDAHARVIVIGGGGIAERINNTGIIVARGGDAYDSIYADADNVLAANTIFVTAIDIDANGSLSEITNINAISAIITGRDGEAVAIRDASGTLITLNNSGAIRAVASTSDTTGVQATSFNTIAIDVSANTAGFTLNQTVYTDPDTEIDTVPLIQGDILLGSGDDTINVAGGGISGNISFGDGADTLNISNTSIVSGTITDSDGQLDIMVADNSRLNITTDTNFDVTSATIDGTSIYSPFIDPSTGSSSVLMASGAVTFDDGAVIAPVLSTVLSSTSASYVIADAGTLNIGSALTGLRSDQAPYLYNTTFARDPLDADRLVMSLGVRSTEELGLDAPQASLFSSAFEALQATDALGSAFVRITDQANFNAAYNQLLPEFASASRQFILANVDGATGAVGAHLKNARRSPERTGGAWIEEFAYYADRSLQGQSEQYRGYGFGITGGFDTSIGPFQTVGVNIGFATTEVEDVLGLDEPLDVLTFQLGGYAGYQTGNLGVELYAGVGYDDFEANRNVVVGNFNQSASADWSGVHYNGSASVGYDMNFGEKYFVRPSASLTYLSLSEKAYEEAGTSGIELAIDKRTVNTATASATLEFGAKFEKESTWFAPSLRVGYRNDFLNDGVLTTGRFVNGTTPFSLMSEAFSSSGVMVGFSLASGSRYSSFSLDVDSEIRDGFSRHTARMVLRLLF